MDILIQHAVIGAILHGSICIIDCGNPPTPAHGTVTLTPPGKTTVGSTATRMCNPGYELVGTANLLCRDDGLWSASPVICTLRGMSIFMNRFNNQTKFHLDSAKRAILISESYCPVKEVCLLTFLLK